MKAEEDNVTFSTWKWKSLRSRRRFLFILLNIFLWAIWLALYYNLQFHLIRNHERHESRLFLDGLLLVLICFHSIILVLSVCESKLQFIVEEGGHMGTGLVYMMLVSLFLVFLFSVFLKNLRRENSALELSYNAAAVTIMSPRLMHNMGFSKHHIVLLCSFLAVPWVLLLVECKPAELSMSFWVMLVLTMTFAYADGYIQECEYKHHFDSLKDSLNLEEKESNFDFNDIISTVGTIAEMINHLDFDIRYRVKRGLDYCWLNNDDWSGALYSS